MMNFINQIKGHPHIREVSSSTLGREMLLWLWFFVVSLSPTCEFWDITLQEVSITSYHIPTTKEEVPCSNFFRVTD